MSMPSIPIGWGLGDSRGSKCVELEKGSWERNLPGRGDMKDVSKH